MKPWWPLLLLLLFTTPVVAQTSLTNSDIERLLQAHASEDTITQAIRESTNDNFDLSDNAVAGLKELGATQPVLDYMKIKMLVKAASADLAQRKTRHVDLAALQAACDANAAYRGTNRCHGPKQDGKYLLDAIHLTGITTPDGDEGSLAITSDGLMFFSLLSKGAATTWGIMNSYCTFQNLRMIAISDGFQHPTTRGYVFRDANDTTYVTTILSTLGVKEQCPKQ